MSFLKTIIQESRASSVLIIASQIQLWSKKIKKEIISQPTNEKLLIAQDFLLHETLPQEGVITINQIRETVRQVSLKSNQLKLVFILNAETMTLEAQNSLLKTLEEPPPQTIIFLFSRNPLCLVPTIRSRCLNLFLPKIKKKLIFSQERQEKIQRWFAIFENDLILNFQLADEIAAKKETSQFLTVFQNFVSDLICYIIGVPESLGRDIGLPESLRRDIMPISRKKTYQFLGRNTGLPEFLGRNLGNSTSSEEFNYPFMKKNYSRTDFSLSWLLDLLRQSSKSKIWLLENINRKLILKNLFLSIGKKQANG